MSRWFRDENASLKSSLTAQAAGDGSAPTPEPKAGADHPTK